MFYYTFDEKERARKLIDKALEEWEVNINSRRNYCSNTPKIKVEHHQLIHYKMKKLMSLLGMLSILLFLHSCSEKEIYQDTVKSNKTLLYSVNEYDNAGIFWVDKISDFHQLDMVLNNGVPEDVIQDIVVYSSKTYAEVSEIEPESTLGFSLYYSYKGKNMHKAFILENGSFYEKKEYTLEVSGVSANDCNFIMKELRAVRQGICCYYIIKSNESAYFEATSQLRLKRVRKTHINLAKDVPGGGSSGDCDDPCAPDPDYCDCIIVIDDGEPIDPCEPCICPAAYLAEDEDVASNYDGEYIVQNINLDLFYDFRDSFLLNHDIGIKYYDYYKVLGNYVISEELLTIEKKLAIVAKMPSVASLVATILSPESPDETVVTEEIKEDLLDLLALFYDESDNSDFKAILDDLKQDIEMYSGLSHQELMDQID